MARDIVATKRAPMAVGPYSQAVCVDGLVFISGQLPIDPVSGSLLDNGIGEQTRQILGNLEAILEAAGQSLTDIVKTTVYMRDMGDFAAMNEAYGESFPDAPPARACLEARRLPKDAAVMIDCIAAQPRPKS